MAHAIEVSGLTKRFGPVLAVDDLSFTADEGRVVGFLGPNGAGKTTTLRMLLGLVNPTAGSATIHGQPFAQLARPRAHGRRGARRRDAASRAAPAATTCARSRAPAGVADPRVDELLELVGAQGRGRPARRAATRSACASGSASPRRCSATRRCSCSTSPPTAWTRRASAGCATSCARLAGEGRAILVSSHVLAEVAQTADDVVVINKGRCVAQAPLAEIMAAQRRRREGRGPGRPQARATSCTREGANVSGDAAEILVQDRTGEQIGRVIAEHQLVISELAPIGLVARGDLLRAHRHDDGRPVMTRLIGAELFKLRTHAHVLRRSSAASLGARAA